MNNSYSNKITTTKGRRNVCFIYESYGLGHVSGGASLVSNGLTSINNASNIKTSAGGGREICIILTANPLEPIHNCLVYIFKRLGRVPHCLIHASKAFFLKPMTSTLKDKDIITEGNYVTPGKNGVIYKSNSVGADGGDLFPKEDLFGIKLNPITRREMYFRLDTQGFRATGDLAHISGSLRHMSGRLAHMSELFGHVSGTLARVSKRFAHMSERLAHMSEGFVHVSEGLAHMSRGPGHMLKGMESVSEGLKIAFDGHVRASGKIVRLYRTSKYVHGRPRRRHGGITFATINIEKINIINNLNQKDMTPQRWMKKNHAELYAQLEQVTGYLNSAMGTIRTRMGFGSDTPQGEWYDTDFTTTYTTYCASYAIWNNEGARSRDIKARFATDEKAMIDHFTVLYKSMLKDNFLVTNEDLSSMDLPMRGGDKPHPSPVATVSPGVEIDLTVIRCVKVRFFDHDSEFKRGKPEGQHGVEIMWSVSDKPLFEIKQLEHSSFDTNSPYVFEFDDDQRGQNLTMALRWENTRGQKGPWSPIFSTIIP
jgi:hypothetical protein